jgi:hypothetical protein
MMIGTLPMVELAPLDYRYALDAARTIFPAHTTPLICCRQPELSGEAQQRFATATLGSSGALWIEPQATGWQAELGTIAQQLAHAMPLIVILSQPMARLIPERRDWAGQPLGMRLGGRRALCQALRRAGLTIEMSYGIHSPASIILSQISHQAARWGRPDLGDRLHFAARLRYCARDLLAAFGTVGLLVVRRKPGS